MSRRSSRFTNGDLAPTAPSLRPHPPKDLLGKSFGDLSRFASEDWAASAAQSPYAGEVLKSGSYRANISASSGGSYRHDYFCFSVKSAVAVAPAFTDTF